MLPFLVVRTHWGKGYRSFTHRQKSPPPHDPLLMVFFKNTNYAHRRKPPKIHDPLLMVFFKNSNFKLHE